METVLGYTVVIRLSPFVGVTDTLNTFYATKRQPLLFSNEKCGLRVTNWSSLIALPGIFFGRARSSRKFWTGVTGQFQISHPICRLVVARSADRDGAFPIRQTSTHAAGQLLRLERRG